MQWIWSQALFARRLTSSRLLCQSSHARLTHNYTQHATDPVLLSSPSEISLAAARAVRMSCANGAIPDALFIVNSLRRSNLYKQPSTEKGASLLMPKLDHDPIEFGKPVSSALSAHCLLHHFVRHGMSLRARHLAERLMQDGTQIRAATLHAVIQCQTNPTNVANLLQAQRPSQRDPLNIIPKQVESQNTRLALKLLLHARQHRQRCSEHTYQFIINMCLVQGEIIVASLLFVLLIRDWEMKRAATQVREHEVILTQAHTATPRVLGSLNAGPPSKRILKMILSKAHEEIVLDPADESNLPRRQAALQALCNIATLLDARLLPWTDISSLIRILYSVPKDPDKVWVAQSGDNAQVQAYHYIHRVLLRLASDPSRSSADARPDQSDIMPPITRESYNALLHYALRHRRSIPLATSLLHHMEHKRDPPLKPGISTYNVVIRSGSLLRRNVITERALNQLRNLEENYRHAIMVQSPPISFTANQPVSGAEESKWTIALKHQKAVLPALEKPLKADVFTLTSYIQHLTATGNPDVVVDILFHVLPELSIIDHPSWGSVTNEQRSHMRMRTRRVRLARAVSLGPWFFMAVLNALCKAGKTGLAERVWLLAKQAERASWTGTIDIDIDGNPMKPWCLPIHAYTIMLQCYGAEARRGLKLRYTAKPNATDWTPKIGGNQVQGWASFVLAQNAAACKHRSRRTLALHMGATLYRIMHHAGMAVCNALSELQDVDQVKLEAPRPDARFFNAALEMFGRQPRTFRRSSRTTPARWRRKITLGNAQFSRLGVMHRNWNPFLSRIMTEMHTFGFKVPSGFRRFFVGRWPYGFWEHRHRPEPNEQPYAFPKLCSSPFRPHALGTLKTRGLPVRRMEWKMHGRRFQCKRRRRRKLQRGEKVG